MWSGLLCSPVYHRQVFPSQQGFDGTDLAPPGRWAPKLRCFANLAVVRTIVREIFAWALPPDRRVIRQGVPVEVSSKNNGCAPRKLCHCLCNLIPEVLLVLRRSVFLWCISCQNGEIPVCFPVFHPDSSKSACHRSRRVVPLHNLSSSNRRLTNGDKHTTRVIAELSIAPENFCTLEHHSDLTGVIVSSLAFPSLGIVRILNLFPWKIMMSASKYVRKPFQFAVVQRVRVPAGNR